jgi:glutathione S-transferase
VRKYLADSLHVEEAARLNWVRHWLTRGLAIGEDQLAGDPRTGRFCHGDEPTIADICLSPQAAAAKLFGVQVEQFPTVSRIWANCLALDAFARALPLRQPGAPTQS